MKKYLIIMALFVAAGISCKRDTGRSGNLRDVISISVTNTLGIPRADALVEIDVKDLLKKLLQKF